MRKFAISDIHGCYLSFIELLDKIAFSKSDRLYLLGDYIDRGPDSKKVLDKIIELQEEGYHIKCLLGNHDWALKECKADPVFYVDWYRGWGGRQTMASFGLDNILYLEKKYWDFIDSLGLFFEIDNYLLVHAGFNFRKPDPLKPTTDMFFIRNWHKRIDYDWLGDRYIIHGHTPMGKTEIGWMLADFKKDRVLDIDAGCFAKHIRDKGFLCAFDMTNRKLFFQPNLDDVSSYWKR